MKKGIVIGVLIGIALLVGAVFFAFTYFYSKGIGPTEGVTPGMEKVEGVVEVDYPEGDTNPEHLAEVLGSQELYEELRDSKLRKPNSSMRIGYGAEGDWRFARLVPGVVMVIRGEIVDIEGKTITVAFEDDDISFNITKHTSFYSDESVQIGDNLFRSKKLEFEDIHVGDKVLVAQIAIISEDNILVQALMVER